MLIVLLLSFIDFHIIYCNINRKWYLIYIRLINITTKTDEKGGSTLAYALRIIWKKKKNEICFLHIVMKSHLSFSWQKQMYFVETFWICCRIKLHIIYWIVMPIFNNRGLDFIIFIWLFNKQHFVWSTKSMEQKSHSIKYVVVVD